MRRIVGCLLVLLLALPAWQGQARAQDEKEPPSPKKRYDALLKDFSSQRSELIPAINKAKGAEQQKLIQKYMGLGKDFAEKFYKLAEDDPKSPVATDALFWVLQNGTGSAVYQKAMDKVTTLVGEMPLNDLTRRLNMVRGGNAKFMDSVLRRAEKDEDNQSAGDLLAWLATNGGSTSAGKKATDRLVSKYPDHPAIERLCQTLGFGRTPGATDTLKQILAKASKPRVKAAAALGLGKLLAAQTDKLGDRPAEADKVAAEADKYLVRVIDEFGKDNPALKSEAERELKSLRTLRVGKAAPEISATDLDAKDFKLSDYRGKVVMLDFWGNW